jgi:hypothetical protein
MSEIAPNLAPKYLNLGPGWDAKELGGVEYLLVSFIINGDNIFYFIGFFDAHCRDYLQREVN